jgi:hypothetical protein
MKLEKYFFKQEVIMLLSIGEIALLERIFMDYDAYILASSL